MSPSTIDARLSNVLGAAAIFTSAILVLIVVFLLIESWPVLGRIGIIRFFTDHSWHPVERLFGLSPMLAGTVASSIGATLIAAPLGIGSAVYCRYYAPPLVARIQRAVMTLLAGIPSVVFGFWGLVVIVPLIAAVQAPGASLLAAMLILALMIVPTIALTADAALAAVPEQYRRGAAALGLSPETVIVRVMLPAAKGGIVGGILLAIARALGETMAVIMVAGNVVQVPTSLFDPIRTLTANIALEMAYATADHRSALFVSGLVLSALVAVIVYAAWRVTGGRAHG